MEFSLIHEDKLKVSLTRQDMEELGLSNERIDHSDEITRRVLIEVLEKGREQAGFHSQRCKMHIEVYPSEDGGCMIYYTRLRGVDASADGRMWPGPYPVVFAFGEVEHLMEACLKVSNRYGHRIYKSSLYRLDDEYRLVVYPLDYSDRLSTYFLSEYGRLVGEGAVLAAFCEEHGEVICAGDAIERIAQAMERE